ncbi:MAG: DUF411 domain-containing protein [marine benthic group bacterium]|nr:DUF411 domain-containing protein [Gemmatimonadota bacterium]
MELRNTSAALALVGILTMGLAACGGSADAETADYEAPQPVAEAAYFDKANNEMHQGEAANVSAETLVVYKTETCGCCGKWVDHMAENGFEVEVHDMSQEELGALKTARGIDRGLQSCHTAEIGGYLVEGHVPAKDLQRLLAEKPDGVKGIAVPGMPIGSPGMEAEDGHVDEYEVVTFDDAGETKVYAWY